MLIAICGTICSGRHMTADFLVQQHGFLRLHLYPVGKPGKVGSKITQDHKRMQPSSSDEKSTRGLSFVNVDKLLEFVTKRWQEHWVLTDIFDEETVEALLRRPFTLLVSVDAPVTLRYSRFNARCARRNLTPMPLEQFINLNDFLLYGIGFSSSSSSSSYPGSANPISSPTPPPDPHMMTRFYADGIASLQSQSHLLILNSYTTRPEYFSFLSSLDLTASSRLRPPWDAYFMHLAHLASLRSNCMKRRVGCVLIHNNRIISTGYNGTPRNLTNCNEGGCDRCNQGPGAGSSLSTCLCLHAEENALLEAGRERIREGAVLYCDTCPCLTCSVKIAQVGVKEVVYSQTYNMDHASRRVLAEAGVSLRQYSPPKGGLVTGYGNGGVSMDVDEFSQQLTVRNGQPA